MGTAERDIVNMAGRVAAHDWSSTPLGPMDQWPQGLRTVADLVLAAGHAMQVAWGTERIMLYNDAYAPMLGNRHPDALGLPFREAWPEIWEEIAPLVDRVFAGETVRFEDMPLTMTRYGYPEETWWTFSYSPIRDESGTVVGLLNVTVDTSARVRAERERDEAHVRMRDYGERLRALISASSDVIYTMSADWKEMRQLHGRNFIADTLAPTARWHDVYLRPEDCSLVDERIARAIADKGMFELEHRVRRIDGSMGWTYSRAVPILDEQGEIVEWFGTAADITDRRDLQERQQILLAELQHRTRNLMGVIGAVANMTLRGSADLDDFGQRFERRMAALSRVQGMLSRLESLDRVTFDELLSVEIDAVRVDAQSIELSGPAGIRLRSSTLQIMALAVHELVTNAVKYGALGQPQAHLAVHWRLEQDPDDGRPWLYVDWRESRVRMPSGTGPQGSGEGRRLIERALPYQLNARSTFTMTADGVHCSLAIPVSRTSAEEPSHA